MAKGSLSGGVAVVLVLVSTSLWVLHDARARLQARRPVVARVGRLEIDQPEVWAALCLLVVVLGLPMYIVSRRAS